MPTTVFLRNSSRKSVGNATSKGHNGCLDLKILKNLCITPYLFDGLFLIFNKDSPSDRNSTKPPSVHCGRSTANPFLQRDGLRYLSAGTHEIDRMETARLVYILFRWVSLGLCNGSNYLYRRRRRLDVFKSHRNSRRSSVPYL